MPVSISATLTETENESKFLAFLSEVFKNSKDDLSKEIAAKVSPDQRDQANQKAATQLETNENTLESSKATYWTAQFDLESAQSELQKAPGDLQKKKAEKLAELTLESAKRHYNEALRAVGQPPIS